MTIKDWFIIGMFLYTLLQAYQKGCLKDALDIMTKAVEDLNAKNVKTAVKDVSAGAAAPLTADYLTISARKVDPEKKTLGGFVAFLAETFSPVLSILSGRLIKPA